jgi:hypothetical protein
MWITPKYQDTDFSWPLSVEDKITIFLDRTLGWQLEIANKCANGEKDAAGNVVSEGIPGSGYAVLHIVLSYFEMMPSFKTDLIGTDNQSTTSRKVCFWCSPSYGIILGM